MDSEAVLDRMVSVGLVAVDGDQVYPTEEFETTRAAIRAGDGGHQRPDWVTAEQLDAEHLDTDFVSTAKAVAELAPELETRQIRVIATVLDRLEEPPTTAEAPDGFAPLHQEDLAGFLARHETSIIYVWKPGSTSCEEMATTLGRLHTLPAVDDSVGLGSICVADGAELLGEEYDVGILPTTLFFVGEAVDSRAIGTRDLEYVTRELNILRDAASESGTAGRQSNA